MKQLKIALSGPSGTGKTTLSNIITDITGGEFISTSANTILPEREKAEFGREFGYGIDYHGHSGVITLSNIYPDFAIRFQRAILQARKNIIETHRNFVIDRSPIDNLAYGMFEAGRYFSKSQFNIFLSDCLTTYHQLDGVIRLKYIPEEVEDNSSRIPKSHFQEMVLALFDYYFNKYFYTITTVPVLELVSWDLELKKQRVEDWVKQFK